jgi:hypothetical protein
LLWLGVEEYTGLWEAAAEVARFEADPSFWDACRRTGAILSSMYSRGWITLHRTDEPMVGGHIVDVPKTDVDATLDIGPHWQPPTVGVESIRFKTTALGRKAYDSSATKSPERE